MMDGSVAGWCLRYIQVACGYPEAATQSSQGQAHIAPGMALKGQKYNFRQKRKKSYIIFLFNQC